MTKDEEEIVEQLRKSKGWTNIFWLTETQSRARASESLERSGMIKRDRSKERGYPHMFYELH